MVKREITISVPDVNFLIKKGSNIEMSEEAQEAILKLVALQERTKEAIEQIKKAILEKGVEITPDFKGLVGDYIKGYVKQAEKYKATDKSKVPDECMGEVSYKKLDQSAVENYKKEHGKLPKGVEQIENVTSFVLLYDKQKTKEMSTELFGHEPLEDGKKG